MRPEDVLKFTKAKISNYTVLRDESRAKFDALKAKKEASFWYKLFRMKYECGMFEYWDFHKYQFWISQLEDLQTTAEYYDKLGTRDMYQQFPKDWRDNFYTWCKINGIP